QLLDVVAQLPQSRSLVVINRLDALQLGVEFRQPFTKLLLVHVNLGRSGPLPRMHDHSGLILRLMSIAGAEWVIAPTEIKSTPHSANARTFSRVTPPESSIDMAGLLSRISFTESRISSKGM